MKKSLAIISMLALLGLPHTNLLAAPRELTDAEMDAVNAGNAPVVDPSEEATTATEPNPALQINSSYVDNSINTVTISDQAQQNLTSMINFVAVNCDVQVMMNLNVSINSSIGSVIQHTTGSQSTTQTAIVP